MMDYTKILSKTVQEIPPSGIRKFFDLAATMDNVISLGVGEPDFDTPWSVREAGIYSLEKGRTFYTANAGLLELREELCRYFDRKYHVSYDPKSEVLITVGGSEAIDLLIRCLIGEGDEVLIPEPCFVCYNPCTVLSKGVPVTIETKEEDNFRLMPEQLKEKITDKTKLLILPFPNNPTGGVMSRKDLEAIADVIRDTDIMVLSDEIYAELRYDDEGHTTFSSIEGMKERTIVVNGFSKAFAMTGWRLGYLAAPAPVVEQALKIHQYAIMSSPTISQYAAIEALTGCENEVRKMVDEYNVRRRLVVDSFNKMGLTCFNPEGAFYVFPCIKSTGMTSEEFCERLLNEQKVAVVPGNAFGECGEGFIRVSYAYSLKHLMEALGRIEKFISKQ